MYRDRFDSFTESSPATDQQTATRGRSLLSHGPSRPRLQKSFDSLALRRHASSGSVSQTTSPTQPSGSSNGQGSLRVPGGVVPVLPGDGRSPFRFLSAADDTPMTPMTPMDISPVTPMTPRFGLTDIQPHVAGSSPTSPDDYRSIDFQINAGLAIDETKDSRGKVHIRSASDKVPSIHISSGPSPPSSGRSTPYQQGYDTSTAEEYYAAALARASSTKATATSPLPSPTVCPSIQERRGRRVKVDRDPRRLSTRSLSPPRQRLGSPIERPIERPIATTVVTDPQYHVNLLKPRSPKIGSPLDRTAYFDFFAAREALNRQGETDFHVAHVRNASGSGSAKSFPTPMPTTTTTNMVEAQIVPPRPKITPTPRPPKLVRFGSKIKSEVKGALFAKKSEETDAAVEKESKERKEARVKPRRVEKVEAVHWTDY